MSMLKWRLQREWQPQTEAPLKVLNSADSASTTKAQDCACACMALYCDLAELDKAAVLFLQR